MTTRGSLLSVVLAFLLVSASAMAQDRATLVDEILEGGVWSLASESVLYDAESVETLVGESAESVREYGLIGATRVRLAGPEGTVDTTLYEMVDSSASYGLFALERDWQNPNFELAFVGSESYRRGSELFFWQSRYVVALNGPVEATNALARLIADHVIGQSRKAPVSLFLPAEGLVRESERYILTPEALERTTGIDPTQLGFDNNVEVAVADYRHTAGSGRLAMFLYPTLQLAERHSQAWLESHGNPLTHTRSGPLFALLIESEQDELADSLLSSLRYQSEITWTDTFPDPLTLPQMILTIFAFIGIALAFTLVVGLVFGGFRIYMKTRYPGFVFGTEDDAELIQLKLDQQFTGKRLNP